MNPKEVAIRWFEEVWNGRNAAAIHELMDPQAVGHLEGGDITGPDLFEQHAWRTLLTAFPDLTVAIDGCVGEGEDAVLRWTALGTHQGDLLGVPATGRKVSFSGMTWIRARNGKLIEGWDRWNVHGLLSLLSGGAAPATAQWVEP